MSPITLLHIIMGTLAIAAGALALFSPKGAKLHRAVGNIFFGAMVIMAAAGIWLAVVNPMAISLLVGAFTIYLVATSWMIVRRAESRISPLDYAVLFVALGVVAGGIWFGLEAQNSPSGLKDGFPPFPHYFFAGLALLTAIGDMVMITRRGIAGKQRIARHLWRMCFAYFIAAGSLFTGPGATAFSESIRESGILSAPEPVILAIMLFWLVRVLFTGWYGREPAT